MENISIADLSEFDFTKDKFQRNFLSAAQRRGIISGKHIIRDEALRNLSAIGPAEEGFDFDFLRAARGVVRGLEDPRDLAIQAAATGEVPGEGPTGVQTLREATEAQLAADPARQKVSALFDASLKQMQEGTNILSGVSTPLSEDFARLFSETFGSQQTTGTGGRFFSGEQQFAHSIGARTALQQFGETVLRSGIEGLLQADPLALPQGFLAQAQLASQQNLFNTLFQQGRKARTEAIRRLEPTDFEKGAGITTDILSAIGAFSGTPAGGTVNDATRRFLGLPQG